jgi:cytochrome c oxidase subunit I
MMKKVSRIFLMGTVAALLIPGWEYVWFEIVVVQHPVAGSGSVLLFLAVIMTFGLLWFKWIKRRSKFSIADWFLVACVAGIWDSIYETVSIGKHPVIIQVYDTMFVTDRAYVYAAFAVLFGSVGCIYYFFQKVTGHMIVATLGWLHFAISFAGILVIVHFGFNAYYGLLRRYVDIENLMSYDRRNMYLIWAVLAVAAAQVLFIFNLVYSVVRGKKSRN